VDIKVVNLSDNRVITHLNFAAGYRGGERQTTLLIQELARRGIKQKLFTRVNSELAKKCSSIENLEIIALAKPYIYSFKKFKDSKLIHAHETKAAQVAFFLKKIYKIPYIITRRVDNPIKNNAFTKAMYNEAACNAALSSAIKKGIVEIAAQAEVAIIPSVKTDFQLNQDKIEQIKKRFAGKYLIGNIGELENQHKGQLYLIEAIKKLSLEYDNLHFIFLGKGPDAEQYKQLTAHLDNVTFEGFVDNVGDQCFVFPSLNEGLGSILLDVMKSKVPIIASDIGGIPDIIENEKTGILVPTKDSDSIYNAIKRVMDDTELVANLNEGAYQKALNYTPEKMAVSYLALYNSIIK